MIVPDHDPPLFLTVGIGASAGGLEAFKRFFTAMPADSGMAFILVQHLAPEYKSMLAEIVGRTTRMVVVEARDGVLVEPNCVFVSPPDATMTIVGGRLKVVHPAPPREHRRPIDTFFQSLAEDQGDKAVCIILSGTGSDGAIGLTAVKEHGGLTMAQAEYEGHAQAGMPASAASTGLVDDILAIEAMPERIVSHQSHLASMADGKDSQGLLKDAAAELSDILRALYARTGHDFSEYKENTLVRRLQRRMQFLRVETPREYREKLKEKPEELDFLLREMLISVTHFFRDPGAFHALDEKVLKPLAASKNASEEIRIWVPGCATGEEAYTIAILLREAMDMRRPRPKMQIFGTDLDEHAIAKARLGCFKKPLVGLSDERLERWFRLEGDEYRVRPEIREMCVFSGHSVIKHPPFSKLDLISCRNLMIYLTAPMQDRLMRTFHYALKPSGKLFLGSSESVTRATRLFSVCDKRYRIFERRDVMTTSLPPFSTGIKIVEPSAPNAQLIAADEQLDTQIRRIIEKYSPPLLLLDRADKIVRFSGGAVGAYLEPTPGPASFGLFDILRKSLRPAAKEVLQQVRAGTDAVRRDDVPIRIDGKVSLVSLVAERLTLRGAGADYIVLALHDGGPGPARTKLGDGSAKSVEEVHSLEQELRTTRTQLQSTIDELETANEEMKSSNEEYQSVNEELQSSNEELETAKEEMQSVNEELQTINAELASKNEQLTHLNSDLANFLESADVATLFLDESLRVRRFTRGITEVFRLRQADEGRPITEIASLLDYRDLRQDVTTVLRKLSSIERQVTAEGTGTTFILRIQPYRTVANVIDGVVLTFVDITSRKKAEEALREGESQQRFLLKLSDALRAEPSPYAIADRALGMLREQMQLDRCYVAVYRLTEDIGEFPHQVHDDRLPPLPDQTRLSEFPIGLQIVSNRTLVINDIGTMGGLTDSERASFVGLGTNALINATLRKGENVPLWAICAATTGPRDWTQGEVSLVEDVAERTWAAMERAGAEAALRAAHDTFRQLVDRSPFGIYTVDADFRLAQIGYGSQKVFETVQPAIGRDLAEVLHILWPEPFASEAIAHFRHTLATGETHTEETSEVRADIAVSEAYDWKVERITMPDGRFGVVCHFYDLSERQRHEKHAQLLMAEVNHRANNLLSVVQAVAQQTAKSSDPQTFFAHLSDRIGGLAANQDLLVRNLWHGVEVNELVKSQLAHFKDLVGARILLNGPALTVTAAASQAIAMAVHELATNAAKYGALSNSNGQVHVEWQLTAGANSRFLMSWRESNGPLVQVPTRKGFGRTVIERLVETSVEGSVKVDYAEDGFSWRLETAARNVLVTSGGTMIPTKNAS